MKKQISKKNIWGHVRFTKGEYKGMTGVIQSIIQKRYSKEPTTYRIQIDGYPKPGGWNGKVTATEDQIEPRDKQNPKGLSLSKADLAKLPESTRRQIEIQLGNVEKAEEKAATPKQRAAVAKRKRSLLARIGTRLRLIAATKKYKVQARNLNKAPKKVIKIRARTETDALAEAKRRLGKGFDEFKVKNPSKGIYVVTANPGHRHLPKATPKQQRQYEHILESEMKAGRSKKASKRIAAATVRKAQGNPSKKSLSSAEKWERLWSNYIEALKVLDKPIKGANARLAQARLAKAEKAIRDYDPEAYRKYILKQNPHQKNNPPPPVRVSKSKRNPSRKEVVSKAKEVGSKVLKVVGGAISGAVSGAKKAASNSRKKSVRTSKRNDGAEDRREEFAGRVTGHKELYFSDGTPGGLSTLGPVVTLYTDAGEFKPTSGKIFLSQDADERLYAGTPDKRSMASPNQDFGKVHRIEYRCKKPHLGEPHEVIWFHDFESPLPRLKSDHEGMLHFLGGGYRIKREGIVG